jgi:hypothetical protein
MVAMLPRFPEPPVWLVLLSLIYPVFYTIVSIREYSATNRESKIQNP